MDNTCVRYGRRKRLELPVRLIAGGIETGRGILRNASISGALIETTLQIPVHTNLVVAFENPGRVLNACVVRVDGAALGIEWRDMASLDVIDLLQRADQLTQVRESPADGRTMNHEH